MSMCGEEIRRLESELENCDADIELYKKKSENIIKFLNDLYEGIDENYTESLERNDKLSMNCAKSELDLITKILDEGDKI